MKKLTICVLTLIFAIASFVGCNKNSTEPESDKQSPDISVEYPMNNSVIGDTITFKVNASDNVNILKVAFFIDNTLKSEDTEKPYEYFFEPSNMDIGSIHTFFAKAYDDAGNTKISDTITFHYKWILLLQDDNEPFPRDLDKIYVRSTHTTIEFRIETNGNWSDPHNRNTESIDCAIFLDTDQNPNTGLNPQDSLWYTVGDIGPDFVVVIGVEGDSLWKWGQITLPDTTIDGWEKFTDFNYLNLQNNTNNFELGINLEDIGNPQIVDIVTANITMEPDTSYWDWSPNEGHITYNVNGLYLGKKNNSNMVKKTFNKSYITDKNNFWFKGKNK